LLDFFFAADFFAAGFLAAMECPSFSQIKSAAAFEGLSALVRIQQPHITFLEEKRIRPKGL